MAITRISEKHLRFTTKGHIMLRLRTYSIRPFATIILLVLASKVAAQTNSDQCSCNAVLMQGVYNYRAERGDRDARAEVERYIARTDYEEFKKSMSAGGGGSYAGFGLSASTSREEYQRTQRQMQEKYRNYSMEVSSRQLLERYGDKNVLDTWAHCKATCETRGLHSWVEENDAKNMILHIKWNPYPETNPIVQNSTIIGAKLIGDSITPGTLFPKNYVIPVGESRLSIHRDNMNEPVVINVEIRGMDIAEYVPQFIPVIGPQRRDPIIQYLSDMEETGSGGIYPDGIIGKDKSVSPNTAIIINGREYDKGLATHPEASSNPAYVEYELDGEYTTFTAVIGLVDWKLTPGEKAAGCGTVIFRVLGDGRELFKSAVMSFNEHRTINLNIAGVKTLRLEAKSANGKNCGDHAAWADARVVA